LAPPSAVILLPPFFRPVSKPRKDGLHSKGAAHMRPALIVAESDLARPSVNQTELLSKFWRWRLRTVSSMDAPYHSHCSDVDTCSEQRAAKANGLCERPNRSPSPNPAGLQPQYKPSKTSYSKWVRKADGWETTANGRKESVG